MRFLKLLDWLLLQYVWCFEKHLCLSLNATFLAVVPAMAFSAGAIRYAFQTAPYTLSEFRGDMFMIFGLCVSLVTVGWIAVAVLWVKDQLTSQVRSEGD